MTAASSGAAPGPGRTAAAWVRLARHRLRERPFWIIQALVLAVTGLHIAVEATHLGEGLPLGGLTELPVVLHIVPVVYAGFRYGYEGSILTGIWSGILAIPNIMFWHSERFGWLADLTFIAFVIVLGAVIAVPVERERRQRRRAEAASRRLEILNRIGVELSTVTDPQAAAGAALHRLATACDLRSAAFLRSDPDDGGQDVVAVWPPGTDIDTSDLVLGSTSGRPQGPRRVFPLGSRSPGGALVIEPIPGTELDADDEELLATAAHQIGSALEAAFLQRAEQQQLRRYAREVTRAQERERTRIARDLHDVVAQELVALTRRLDVLSRENRGVSPEVRGLASGVLDTVRRVSRGLRPTVLDDLGLVPALGALADDLGGRTDISARVVVDGQPRRFGSETELALFRIVQEALHNVERHAAGATEVVVSLRFANGGVVLEVSDDGPGLDVSSPGPAPRGDGSGLGLLGMQERAELIGADFAVVEPTGGGVTVRVRLDAGAGPGPAPDVSAPGRSSRDGAGGG